MLPHVVEKVLNHVTPGIAGVYQHHNWLEEKQDALERLATLVFDIVGADVFDIVNSAPGRGFPPTPQG